MLAMCVSSAAHATAWMLIEAVSLLFYNVYKKRRELMSLIIAYDVLVFYVSDSSKQYKRIFTSFLPCPKSHAECRRRQRT